MLKHRALSLDNIWWLVVLLFSNDFKFYCNMESSIFLVLYLSTPNENGKKYARLLLQHMTWGPKRIVIE